MVGGHPLQNERKNGKTGPANRRGQIINSQKGGKGNTKGQVEWGGGENAKQMGEVASLKVKRTME